MTALGITLSLLVLGYWAGRRAEARHYRSIHEREQAYLRKPATTLRRLEPEQRVARSELAFGSVVVSVDYYKRFIAGLRQIVGGEVRTYSPLLDRARREAILRMKESCKNADLYLNCRLETASVADGRGDSTAAVEVMAYATAIYLDKDRA